MDHRMKAHPAYQDWADVYDTDCNQTRDLDAQLLREAGLPLEGAQVVELGAGTGKNTVFLAEQAAEVVALDFSSAMLDKARRRKLGAHVAFVEHDIRHPWPVPDRAADVIVSNLVLEHISDLEPVFAAAARAQKPQGWLYLSELHPYRQLGGRGARFERAGRRVDVETHLHTVSDYVNGARAHGYELAWMQEAAESTTAAPEDVLPRLFIVVFRKAL